MPERKLLPDHATKRHAYDWKFVDAQGIEQSSSIGLTDVLKWPAIRRLLVLYFLIFLGFSLFYVAFPIRAARDAR